MNRLFVIFGVLGFVFFLSCEKSIDYQLSSEDSEPVLYMFPMQDSLLKVYASFSTDILATENYSGLEEDASLTIGLVNGKEYQFTYKQGEEVQTYNSISFLEGDTINVTCEIGEIVLAASTFIPEHVVINDIRTSLTEEYNENNELEEMLRCIVSFDDSAGIGNFYQLRVDLETIDEDGNKVTETLDYIKESNVFSATDRESVYITDIDYEGTFNDDTFDGRICYLYLLIPTSYLDEETGIESKQLNFYLYSLTEDYYEYIRSLIEVETYREDPLYQQSNLYSNVEGGLGTVAGLSVSVDTVVVY